MTELELKRPWLVAAWPGMGSVAQLAAAYLTEKLKTRRIHAFPTDGYFDVSAVQVRGGLLAPGRLPKTWLDGWNDPEGETDLLILTAEEQPVVRSYEFCKKVLDFVEQFRVPRVLTFAAMATPMHPKHPARVFAAANTPELLGELEPNTVHSFIEGEITGLNGVLLAAAAARGLESICLLGELPYFATAALNPKAASAVLRVFSDLSHVPIDLADLDAKAAAAEWQLLEQLQRLADRPGGESGLTAELTGSLRESQPPEPEPQPQPQPDEDLALDLSTELRIEALFEAARKDRSKAMDLKSELDRLDLFKRYEDRFLDLFKRAE